VTAQYFEIKLNLTPLALPPSLVYHRPPPPLTLTSSRFAASPLPP